MHLPQVEIRLCKATGVRWDSLEHKEQTDANSGRAYPTSNRRDPVDWDRVEAEVMKPNCCNLWYLKILNSFGIH